MPLIAEAEKEIDEVLECPAQCRPVVGSSRSKRVRIGGAFAQFRDLALMRCASPPLRVLAALPQMDVAEADIVQGVEDG